MGTNVVTIRKAQVDIEALGRALTSGAIAKVGFPEETTGSKEHADSDLSMAALAAIHELGKGNVPPRPFMRQGADILVTRRGLIAPHVRRLASGRIGAAAFLTTVGLLLKSSIRAAVDKQDFTPLAPATVEAKGSDQILIETGAMLEALDVFIGTDT